ncbi:MAG: MOSC domain-containing protein [Bacteroidota bacterium]
MADGRVVQVNVSQGGIPKKPVPEARVTFARVEGDDWNNTRAHGLPGQAVCLYSVELIDEMKAGGYPLFAGALGENLTTEGIDFRAVRRGDIYRIGAEAEIRITRIRIPCKTITIYGANIREATYDAEVHEGNTASPRWGKSGFYAEVLKEGVVRPGDLIVLVTRGTPAG